MRRAFADTELGQIHYAETGAGDPVLFLHETPRSWDQFRDVLPLVGQQRRAIAMDTVGFGDSCDPRDDAITIEAYAEGALMLIDQLGLERVDLVGHHTGGVVAIEVAAAAPERVGTLVLSSTPLVESAFREAHEGKPLGVDEAERSAGGEHLTELWGQRLPHYPDDSAELLERYLIDALKSEEHAAGGHAAVTAYEMEPRLELVRSEVHLIIGG
ncbi:MAG: alpha/beta fold hydrolase, partial [Actinobacteria bacterium]|nr:alpha/beta fold hydrolase [Actinomycetota bacterium]